MRLKNFLFFMLIYIYLLQKDKYIYVNIYLIICMYEDVYVLFIYNVCGIYVYYGYCFFDNINVYLQIVVLYGFFLVSE